MKRRLFKLKVDIKFFFRRFKQLFCEHEISICGGDDIKNTTKWICLKCRTLSTQNKSLNKLAKQLEQ